MADAREALLYTVADPLHYETPSRLDDDTRYPPAHGVIPPGWRRSLSGLWAVMTPDDTPPAGQGWKIHVSATPRTAAPALERTAALCLTGGVPFKFLRSERALTTMSGPYAPRSAGGKFITVYPRDDPHLAEILGELLDALDGLPGPYILSDLRIGRGPVHVRYGSFVARRCPGEDGRPVPALVDPSGTLVPDVRGAAFRVPEWVTPPPVLEPHLAARRAARDDAFPYVVHEALRFSNAGGVYRAAHRDTGRPVVLREARPFSGLDGTGSDAVERLHREYRILMELQGLDCVPRLYGLHTVWEHHFLVREHVEGPTLLEAVIGRYPLPGRNTSKEAFRAYAEWASRVIGHLTSALDSLHERGVCLRDFHPRNIVVRSDDSVVLVDFEYATGLDVRDLPRVGAAGFAAPAGATGAEADQYGLWATWLFTLMAMPELTDLDPAKAAQLEAIARDRFDLSATAGPHRPEISSGRTPSTPPPALPEAEDLFGSDFDSDSEPFDWPAVRDALVAGIHADATPDRADRLFPAHWTVFDRAGHTLAHGAAGVLLALHRVGATVPASYTDWLVRSARRAGPGAGYGLYDGPYGAAAALAELGCGEAALEILSTARTATPPTRPGLYGGQAGVGLALCHFAELTGDSTLLDEATRIAQRLDTLRRDGAAEGLLLPSTGGLLDGFSGSALLQLRLHGLTGDRRYLPAARAALELDLEHCVTMPDGTVQARYGHRHLAYLEEGSGGMALVAREYLARADAPSLTAFTRAVRPVCASDFVREPGLFRGRAGHIAVLSLLDATEQHTQPGPEALASIRRLSWHAIRTGNGLRFPGRGLLRLSTDLATGSAGVLLALHTAFEGDGRLGSLLPFAAQTSSHLVHLR
ncbi:class III lanthionine synthetase LanKC [Streptomyces sp. NPDC101175]|uniref:class III lanthionine synthetase LanKC n=1 Tax=Streptomyces sp. NPDC101175 TaxID=3366123 RepID=UPI0038341997